MIEPNITLTHVKRAFSFDEYGNPAGEQETEVSRKALLSWETSSLTEDLTGISNELSGTLYLSRSVPVSETDIFIIDGKKYRITGSIERWNPPANFSIKTFTRMKITLLDGVVDA